MNGEELQILWSSTQGGPPVPIAYRFQRPEANKPVFVWFCGFQSKMESVKADALAGFARENGAGCLRFDYSGHGRSGGRFENGTIGDWLSQAAAVCAHALVGGPVVFVGSSMGGWIALLLARQLLQAPPYPVPLPVGRGNSRTSAAANSGVPSPLRGEGQGEGTFTCNLKGIALIAPAWDMTRLFWERATLEIRQTIMRDGVYYRPSAYDGVPYPFTRALFEDGERHFFGAGPIPLSVPVRILHGCEDPDIPWRHSLALMDAVACPDMRLTLVKDGEHRLSRPQDLAQLFSILSEFL